MATIAQRLQVRYIPLRAAFVDWRNVIHYCANDKQSIAITHDAQRIVIYKRAAILSPRLRVVELVVIIAPPLLGLSFGLPRSRLMLCYSCHVISCLIMPAILCSVASVLPCVTVISSLLCILALHLLLISFSPPFIPINAAFPSRFCVLSFAPLV